MREKLFYTVFCLVSSVDLLEGRQVVTCVLVFCTGGDEIDLAYLQEAFANWDATRAISNCTCSPGNSEHYRHKIFNADWIIDGKTRRSRCLKPVKSYAEKRGTMCSLPIKTMPHLLMEGSRGGALLRRSQYWPLRFSSGPTHLQ